MDEAIAIPSEAAMKVSLRTQQVLLEETGVANSVDPLAGSYMVESLTNEMEARIMAYIAEIDALGGAASAAEDGYFQREIADSAYRYQRMKETKELAVVGVNKYYSEDFDSGLPFEPHRVDPGVEAAQIERLHEVKRKRNNALVLETLKVLTEVASTDENVIPATLAAVRAKATLGEIVDALKDVFGTYRERPIF
jgi:methylmalonyl-CoA mutase N-terminal domain/subunit